VQVTKSLGNNWQPDWSPDGKYIAYRSEDGEGGLFVIPALGGEGQERKISSFGYYPRWSLDGSQILFQTTRFVTARLYVVDINGGAPRELMTSTLHPEKGNRLISANWYPDGKRISLWLASGMLDSVVPVFWTTPLDGGAPVQSEIPAALARQFVGASSDWGAVCCEADFKFAWAPSGTAIYFERTLGGTRNLWRMTVDRTTLQAIAIDRLTTGSGMDSELAISPDGKQLAFTGGVQHMRAWLFPFEAGTGRITGEGSAVTSSGIDAFEPSLSPDGKQLIFMARRAGKWDLMKESLADRRDTPFVYEDDFPYDPQWSPDGKHLAYGRWKQSAKANQIMVWSSESRKQVSVTDVLNGFVSIYEWSKQDNQLVLSMPNSSTRGGMVDADGRRSSCPVRSP